MSIQLLSEKERTSAKNHRCIWCGEQINQGQRYLKSSVLVEGDFHAQKWHPECKLAGEEMSRNNNNEFYFEPYDEERPTNKPTVAP